MTSHQQQQLLRNHQPANEQIQESEDHSSADPLTIAAILDTSPVFPWVEELISFTVSLINNHTDGWFDDILLPKDDDDGSSPPPLLQYTLSDAACKHDVAVRAYLNITRGGNIPNAILGSRCSSPSIAIASLASAENVALLSPAATNPKLTKHNNNIQNNEDGTSTSNRLVAPDDASGQAGALVTLLREFGWDRISIINTDTPYAHDFSVELARAWEGTTDGGEIGTSGTVQVGSSNKDEIEVDSVKHLLQNWPVDNPRINSRVIVLLAHHNHAYQILKIANEMNFQPDTIYIGVDAWTGRDTPKDNMEDDNDASWMPDIPGYIGIVPYRDTTSPLYIDFLERLQADQRTRGVVPVTPHLEDSYALRTVDSVLALAMALSNVTVDQRHNGTAVVQALRSLKFDGISGPVEFNENGDWANPRYTVMTLPKKGSEFIPIGSVEPGGPVHIDMSKICYPQIGCNVDHPPSATYPVPSESEIWSVVLLGVLGVIVAVLVTIAYRFHQSRRPLKEKLRLLQEEIEGLDSNDGAVQKRKGSLYKEIARLLDQPRPTNWSDDQGLVSIPPTDEEYWTVLQKMRETMSEPVWITELSRCQNDGVWSYYVFRKNQLASKYGVDLNHPDAVGEIDAWHGTSSLNPDVIYNDNHDGFMMQYSLQGLYGRGLYFAERFEYSDCYSYRVNAGATFPRGSVRQEGEDREIFLVKLLVGQSITMSHIENEEECRNLVTAPENPNSNGLRYDTVSGMVAGETKIHTVYENGRAYPSYLIRYYKGARDPSRTEFETQEEAMADLKMKMDGTLVTLPSDMDDINNSDNNGAVNDNPLPPLLPPPPIMHPPDDIEQGSHIDQSDPLWMYEDDQSRPAPFDRELQSTLERAYQADPGGSITIQKGTWAYNVDFLSMTQTNRDHPAHRRRNISRLELRT